MKAMPALLIGRSKKAEAECWKKAIKELARCQVDDCNRHGIPPITTVSGPR